MKTRRLVSACTMPALLLGTCVSASAVELPVALDGQSVVCTVETNNGVPGKMRFAADYQGRRYPFPNAKTRNMFIANPGKCATK